MSTNPANVDNLIETDDVFEQLDRLFDSMKSEEKELEVKNKSASPTSVDNVIESDDVFEQLDRLLDSFEAEEKELKFKDSSIKNEFEDEPLMIIKDENDEKISDEDNNTFEYKASHYNSEDSEEEIDLYAMVICDEVASDGDRCDDKIELETTVANNEKKRNENNYQFEYKAIKVNSEEDKDDLDFCGMNICDGEAGDWDKCDSKKELKTTVASDKDKSERNSKQIKNKLKKKERRKKSNKKIDSKSKKYSRTPSIDRSSKKSLLNKSIKTIDKEQESENLRELDTFWKIVRDDPTNFDGWTYLLQYVDGTKNIEATREAYDALLNLYPYCYAYWKKYADFERKNGAKENCEKVFERGLKAVPLSVDLWIHYIDYIKSVYCDDQDMIREQFERALEACGIDFRSDILWDYYIKFELKCKQYTKVTAIYERLIATPTCEYLKNFERFQDYVKKYPINKILETVEFLELQKEILTDIKEAEAKKNHDRKFDSGSNSNDMAVSKKLCTKKENLMQEKIITSRMTILKTTAKMVSLRLPYELLIKRQYFHIQPLEESDIRNWTEYLDFEISQGFYKRIIVLFERCLIACALYEEFWIKYINFLESLENDDQEVKDCIDKIYSRACTVYHKNKMGINLMWAFHLENSGQVDKAAQILDMLDNEVPHKMLVIQRRINLERRRSCYDRVCELYEHYINTANSTLISILLTVKYARFVWRVLNKIDRATEILWAQVEKINSVQKSDFLLLQLIEIKMSDCPINSEAIVQLIDRILNMESIDLKHQIIFTLRKVEYLEEFSKDIVVINKAIAEYKKYVKNYNNLEKKSSESFEENLWL